MKHCYRIGPDIVAATDEANAWEVLRALYGSVDDFEGEEPELVDDDDELIVHCDVDPRRRAPWFAERVQVARKLDDGAWRICAPASAWANDPNNTTGAVASTEY